MDVYFTFNFITIVLQNQLNARPNNPSSQWGLLLLDTHCSSLLTMHSSQAQIRKGGLLTKTFLIERYLQVIQHIFCTKKVTCLCWWYLLYRTWWYFINRNLLFLAAKPIWKGKEFLKNLCVNTLSVVWWSIALEGNIL